MAEVHPNFSEAPHLRSPKPHPKTVFSENQTAFSMDNHVARVYRNAIFRSNTGIPTILGQGTPSFSKKNPEV